MTSLITLLLAAAPACTTSTDGGTVITCGDVRVLVSLSPGTPAESLQRVVDGMTKLYSAVETTPVKVTLGKDTHAAIDIALLKSAKERIPMGHALVTALPEKDAKALSRVLVCTWEMGKPTDACQRGFELAQTVSNPAPPEPTLPGGKSAWSGVALPTPQGCQLVEPGALTCREASLMWGDRPNDGPLNSQKLLAELALRQLPPGSSATERACRIAGKPSTCSLLKGVAKGAPFSVLIGVGEVQGRWTSFQCIAPTELKDTVPAPCDALVGFSPTSPH